MPSTDIQDHAYTMCMDTRPCNDYRYTVNPEDCPWAEAETGAVADAMAKAEADLKADTAAAADAAEEKVEVEAADTKAAELEEGGGGLSVRRREDCPQGEEGAGTESEGPAALPVTSVGAASPAPPSVPPLFRCFASVLDGSGWVLASASGTQRAAAAGGSRSKRQAKQVAAAELLEHLRAQDEGKEGDEGENGLSVTGEGGAPLGEGWAADDGVVHSDGDGDVNGSRSADPSASTVKEASDSLSSPAERAQLLLLPSHMDAYPR